MADYKPRRARSRWTEDAPAYVLDCFDDKKGGERYTVVFGADHMSRRGSYADSWVSFLGMDDAPTHPQGVSMWGEMRAHEMAAYRYANGRRRVRWLDLPEHIRAHVIKRATL